MARGWDSKSVEAQIDASATDSSPAPDETSPAERERQAHRAHAQLCRARILQDLDVAQEPRYRAMLERARRDIEAQLAAIDGEAASRPGRS
jgi:hypothetical protein